MAFATYVRDVMSRHDGRVLEVARDRDPPWVRRLLRLLRRADATIRRVARARPGDPQIAEIDRRARVVRRLLLRHAAIRRGREAPARFWGWFEGWERKLGSAARIEASSRAEEAARRSAERLGASRRASREPGGSAEGGVA